LRIRPARIFVEPERLLELTRRHADAVRVLSEAARSNPHTIAAELRRIGARADADEVLALADGRRGRTP
jgi:hypothetical protein